MNVRLNVPKTSPAGMKAMLDLEAYVTGSGLDHKLLHLIKVRASQMNGCAFCLDMHWKRARADGESEQRLYALDAWREAPFYTPRERAALKWTEALTLISETHAPDELYEAVRGHFSDKEIVDLSFAVVTINSWNRLMIAFRAEVPAVAA